MLESVLPQTTIQSLALILVAVAGGGVSWVIAWLLFEFIPSRQHFGSRVRWGAPPHEWFAPPGPKRRGNVQDALALVEYRSRFSLRRRLVYIPPLHTLLIGPSGSGKSTSLMSALLTWGGGVLVLDPKGEFFETTAGWRCRALKQAILCWDIRSGTSTDGGLPIEAMYGSRENAIDQLAGLIIGEDNKQAPFVHPWRAIIKALLADAAMRGLPPWQTALHIPSSQWESVLESIARQPDHPGRPHALEALGKKAAPEYFASIAGTADQVEPVLRSIAGLLDAGIGRPVPDLSRTSIYVILPTNPLPGEKLALRWIFSGAERYVSRGDPLPKPGCVWIIDEAGALRPNGLDDWVRFMRGKRVSVIVSTQNVSDLNAAYGQDNAASIIGAMNGPHIFIGWRQMSESTVALLAQSLASFTTTRRRNGDRYETMPGDVADARRMISRLKHGVMFSGTGADRPCPVYPAPFYRWFKDRQLPPPTEEELRNALRALDSQTATETHGAHAPSDDRPTEHASHDAATVQERRDNGAQEQSPPSTMQDMNDALRTTHGAGTFRDAARASDGATNPWVAARTSNGAGTSRDAARASDGATNPWVAARTSDGGANSSGAVQENGRWEESLSDWWDAILQSVQREDEAADIARRTSSRDSSVQREDESAKSARRASSRDSSVQREDEAADIARRTSSRDSSVQRESAKSAHRTSPRDSSMQREHEAARSARHPLSLFDSEVEEDFVWIEPHYLDEEDDEEDDSTDSLLVGGFDDTSVESVAHLLPFPRWMVAAPTPERLDNHAPS